MWRERSRYALAHRLVLWYSVLFLASSLALAMLTYVLLSNSLKQRDRDIIQSTLVRYAGAYEQGGLAAIGSTIRADQATGRYERLLVRVLGSRRDVVFLSMPDDWAAFDLTQLSTPRLLGTESWSSVSGPGDSTMEIGTARLADGTLFQVGKSTESRAELLVRFRRVLLVDLVSVVVISFVGGAVLTYWGLQPIRDLIHAVRETLRTGHLRARVPVRQTGDAVDELSGLFNEMLSRIDASVTGMRGALDNVAHDLRTPMMRLRGIAETALGSPGDARTYRDALTDCLEESDRVVTMLNTLMDISEAETGTMRLDFERLNLTTVIGEAVELYEHVADDKGVSIEITAPDELALDADRNRMRQTFANLLDNAVKYTQPGGRVSIDAREQGPHAIVIVRDSGVGIGPADLPRIWDRLYRGDESRSERGLGLGLSLVKAIVEAHAGRVTATSGVGEGTAFTVTLPLRSSRRSVSSV